MTLPTAAGPDTVCACSHWYEEHGPYGCAGCDAAAFPDEDVFHLFEFWPEYNTPEAIANRGGDPEKWPAWVKEGLNARSQVSCDYRCGAYEEPETLDEYEAALSHWRDHQFLSGCSHAC